MPNNTLQVEHYRAKDGWRWRMWRGGRIIAESGEAYARKDGVKRALLRFGSVVRRTSRWVDLHA